LLKNPVEAIQQKRFVISKEEEEKLQGVTAGDLSDFSQQVLILFEQKE